VNLEECPGICARRIRETDWSDTPLGPRSEWPRELRQLLFMALRSSAPKLILWGEAQTTLYNDALMDALCAGAQRIGQTFAEFHGKSWEQTGADIARALKGVPLLKSEVGQWCALKPSCEHVPWLELCYTPVPDSTGTPAGVLIDVRDLSRERQREIALEAENSRLQRLFDDAHFLIAYAAGPDLRIGYANKACEVLFPGQQLVGETIAKIVPDLVALGHIEGIRDVLRTGDRWLCSDVRIVVLDPSTGERKTHFVDFNCAPLRNEQGAIIGILGSGYDVTGQHIARLEADQLRHQLLHNTRINAMGTMAMTLAHELNQPLTASANLIAAARLLTGPDASEAQAALDRAQQEIQRAGSLIRRMRSLVRSGPSENPSISIEQAFLRTVGLLEASGSHGVKLTLRLAPDATTVQADEIQLEQILTNLFRNAIQASAHSARKEIILSTERTPGGAIRISMQDFGPGFPPERLANAFEYSGLDEGEGLGIGLPLTRTLVEANGGDIEIRNAPDGGAITLITMRGPTP